MKRKSKLVAAVVLAVLFGFAGFDTAIGGALAGYDVAYCLGALLPFLFSLAVALDQHRKFVKERVQK